MLFCCGWPPDMVYSYSSSSSGKAPMILNVVDMAAVLDV